MSSVLRISGMLALSVLLAAPAAFAGDPPTAESKSNKSEPASAKKSAEKTAEKEKRQPGAAAAPAPAAPAPSPAPQGAMGASAPVRPLVPATTGGLGLFTVESGDMLPARSFAASAGVNKFSREPGSITVLNVGWNFSVGLHDRLTLFAQWDPHRYIHVSRPGRLSLNAPGANPLWPETMYRVLVPGGRPGYVEEYPFAFTNTGGVGEVVLGLKYALALQSKGNPFNLAVRNDFIIPTRTTLNDLLGDGVQSGQFNYQITGILSRTWGEGLLTTFNAGARFARDPRANGVRLMQQADQLRFSAGFLIFPERRFQLMSEYTGIVFTGSATPNTTFGARNPVDGVWGFRWYARDNVAFDVGYRYMLNLRAHGDRSGFVIKVGTTHWGERVQPNRPPTAACSADKSSVYVGSGDTVRVTARASDPDGDPLTTTWSASGGRIEGSGSEITWNSASVAQGVYTVTARVDDGRGGVATCAVDIRVEPRPNRPPTMTCSADRTTVLVGERVRITATASDPDSDPLTFTWRTNAGTIVGTGASVQLDTSGVEPGRYAVTGRVEDGRGGAADCRVDVAVEPAPPPPTASKINECFFRPASARVDNVCKRILDDVALRMQNEPRSRVVIIGSADPGERNAARLAQQRADAAKAYLGERGIAAARVETRTTGGRAGAGRENRRVDIIFVPEGASY